MRQEQEEKLYWLRKFRMANNFKTLHLMVAGAVDKHYSKPPIIAAIYLAECQRERELEQGRLLQK